MNTAIANPPVEAAFMPVQTTPFSFGTKLKIRLWAFLNATVFRWSPFFLRGFRRALLKSFGAKLAATASIHNTARIDCPWNLIMDDHASIGEHAWIYCLAPVSIGANTCIGQGTALLTGTHDPNDLNFSLILKPVSIGRGVWVAVRSIVLPGISIGDFSVVGAGSVVTRNLPGGQICGGNPCRPIKPRQLPRQ